MGTKSDFAENHFLKYLLSDEALTRPTVTAVALGTATSGENTFTEADNSVNKYDNYARVTVNRDSTGAATQPYWGRVGGGTINASAAENIGVVTFATGVAGDTELLKEFAVWDSATYGAGNMWAQGALASNLQMGIGVIPEFSSGALDVTEE